MYNRKGSKGVITVMVSLMLVGVLSLGTMVIEAGRYQAAKTQLAEANISASTSMIAAYHGNLYERFGLLSIDKQRFKPERAADYLNFNADQAYGYKGNRLSRLYVADTVELTGMYNLTYPSILKRQVLTRAKYHVIPQNYAFNITNADSVLSDFQSKCLYVAQQLETVAYGYGAEGTLEELPPDVLPALEALCTTYAELKCYDPECNAVLSSGNTGAFPSRTGTVLHDAPAEDVADINALISNATTVLGSAGSALSYQNGTVADEINVDVSVSAVSRIKNELKDLTSCSDLQGATRSIAGELRAMALGMNNAINMLRGDKDGAILLNSYITDYFPNRAYMVSGYSGPARESAAREGRDSGFVSACVEYVFQGNADEKSNQEATYAYVQAVRLIHNLYSVMTDSEFFDSGNVVNVAAHIAWANYESLVDVELMAFYNVSVPLYKNQMILPIQSPAGVSAAFMEHDMTKAMVLLGYFDGSTFAIPGSNEFSYRDTLAFALWFVPNSEKLMRTADLIQMEMRYRERYVDGSTASFLMSEQNTYCRIKCSGKFNAALPVLSLGGENSVQGTTIQSIKYAGY